jgi:hypothetical protein
MRKIRYEFLLIAGLIMTLGCATVFANGNDKRYKNRPKNSGVLTIAADQPYDIEINGKVVPQKAGDSDNPAVFYLRPDVYEVRILDKDGKVVWADDDVDIKKNEKTCICVETVTHTEKYPCPYDVHLEAQPTFKENEIITIRAVNTMSGGPDLTYRWTISAGEIIGDATGSSIRVNTAGATEIDVDIDVNDGMYKQCQQGDSLTTVVIPKEPEPPKAYICDEFPFKSYDDDKARLDNCSIRIQTTPDSKLYIIIYPASSRRGGAQATYDRLSKRTLQYLINVRGMDPGRVQIVRGMDRPGPVTTYVMWVIPPGADTPVR